MRFRPLPILTLFALFSIALLVSLGNWQWQRYQQKLTAREAGIQRVTLVNFEPELRLAMRPNKFLTRDPRAVERKKYGRAKARRSFQFSKR